MDFLLSIPAGCFHSWANNNIPLGDSCRGHSCYNISCTKAMQWLDPQRGVPSTSCIVAYLPDDCLDFSHNLFFSLFRHGSGSQSGRFQLLLFAICHQYQSYLCSYQFRLLAKLAKPGGVKHDNKKKDNSTRRQPQLCQSAGQMSISPKPPWTRCLWWQGPSSAMPLPSASLQRDRGLPHRLTE